MGEVRTTTDDEISAEIWGDGVRDVGVDEGIEGDTEEDAEGAEEGVEERVEDVAKGGAGEGADGVKDVDEGVAESKGREGEEPKGVEEMAVAEAGAAGGGIEEGKGLEDGGGGLAFLLDFGTLKVSVLDTFPAEGWRAARETAAVAEGGRSGWASLFVFAAVVEVAEEAIAIKEEIASKGSSSVSLPTLLNLLNFMCSLCMWFNTLVTYSWKLRRCWGEQSREKRKRKRFCFLPTLLHETWGVSASAISAFSISLMACLNLTFETFESG
jgi:hypothetical protein